jgi:hypothetical protein
MSRPCYQQRHGEDAEEERHVEVLGMEQGIGFCYLEERKSGGG